MAKTCPHKTLRALIALGFAASAFEAGAVRADGPYEGQWREGPMSIRVDVTSWGSDCGPRPQSTSTPGGGTFSIAQSGDHLTFQLRRPHTTRGCWSENRAVRRVSSSHQAGTWRVVCRTPPDDSRGETGRYTIQAVGADRLNFTDVSEYDWQLNESRCRARIRATQSFTRVGGAGVGSVEPPPRPPRCTPGAAARISLRPARSDVEPGGEQCFTARVVDASGCPVVGHRPSLRAEGGGHIQRSCLQAPAQPGTVRVIASAGSLRAEARVTVRAMDLSDLIARRAETQTDPVSANDEDASSETAARLSARQSEDGPDLLWLGLAIAGALLLLLFGAVVLRSRGKTKPLRDLPIDRSGEKTGGRGRGRSVSAGGAPPSEPREKIAPSGPDMICPSCRRGYAPGSARCAEDDTALVPYKDFVAGAGETVCPTCGSRYPTGVKFCGKDRTRLEPSE